MQENEKVYSEIFKGAQSSKSELSYYNWLCEIVVKTWQILLLKDY